MVGLASLMAVVGIHRRTAPLMAMLLLASAGCAPTAQGYPPAAGKPFPAPPPQAPARPVSAGEHAAQMLVMCRQEAFANCPRSSRYCVASRAAYVRPCMAREGVDAAYIIALTQ